MNSSIHCRLREATAKMPELLTPPPGGNGNKRTIRLFEEALETIKDVKHQLRITGLEKKVCQIFFLSFFSILNSCLGTAGKF